MARNIIIGLTEYVTIFSRRRKKIKARIDTGATRSSMDIKLAEELHLGPIIKRKRVKSAHGSRLRPVIECEIMIAKQRIKAEFTLADREHMKYKVLIGQNVLKSKKFMINPQID